MKKLIYNENTREIDVVEKEDEPEPEKSRIRKVKDWLENNKIFFEIFSFVFIGVMGIVISVFGVKLNKIIVDINQRQLEIAENDRKPHFSMDCSYMSVDKTKIGVDGKIPKCNYNIINKGGDITEVFIEPESYIYFYMPTNIEREYYIFKFRSNDFWTDGGRGIGTIEKNKEYIFTEYIFKEEKMEWEEIVKNVLKYFPSIRYIHKNIAKICYTDYIGENQEEFFSFNGIDIKKESGEEFCILLGDNYGSDLDTQKTGTQEVEEAVLLIKNGIEEWIEENKGSRGHEIPEGTRFGYIG